MSIGNAEIIETASRLKGAPKHATILAAWSGCTKFLENAMEQGKSVNFPGFGIFAFHYSRSTASCEGAIIRQIPYFILNAQFSKIHNLSVRNVFQFEQPKKLVELNFTSAGVFENLTKEECIHGYHVFLLGLSTEIHKKMTICIDCRISTFTVFSGSSQATMNFNEHALLKTTKPIFSMTSTLGEASHRSKLHSRPQSSFSKKEPKRMDSFVKERSLNSISLFPSIDFTGIKTHSSKMSATNFSKDRWRRDFIHETPSSFVLKRKEEDACFFSKGLHESDHLSREWLKTRTTLSSCSNHLPSEYPSRAQSRPSSSFAASPPSYFSESSSLLPTATSVTTPKSPFSPSQAFATTSRSKYSSRPFSALHSQSRRERSSSVVSSMLSTPSSANSSSVCLTSLHTDTYTPPASFSSAGILSSLELDPFSETLSPTILTTRSKHSSTTSSLPRSGISQSRRRKSVSVESPLHSATPSAVSSSACLIAKE